MKSIPLAATVVALSLLSAAPAHATPDQDEIYIKTLAGYDITPNADAGKTNQTLIAAAHYICMEYLTGSTKDQLAAEVAQGNPESPPALSSRLVDIAIATYCTPADRW